MKRAIVVSVLGLLLATTACGRYLRAAAAVVDGDAISFQELDRAVDASLAGSGEAPRDRLAAQRQQLSLIIQDRIIAREAVQRKIVIDPKVVEERYKAISEQFPSEDQLRQALAQQGIALEGLRERIRLRLIAEEIQEALLKQVKITDRQIRESYGRGERYDQFRARHILYSTQTAGGAAGAARSARSALQRIRAGADFAAIAKAESADRGSAERGGDLGLLTRGQTVPEFERAVLALRPGQIGGPVQTQFGIHVVQLLSRTKKTLKQVEGEIREQLQDQAGQEAFGDFIATRIDQARIEINPRLGEFDVESLQIVDRTFFTPASPPAVPEGIPGLQLPGAEPAPG